MDEPTQNSNAATIQDVSRQLDDQSLYTLDVDQASALFSAAGVPRSPRSIDRYCKAGHLVCLKIETERNEKYLITKESVTQRITELQQVAQSGHAETLHDTSRHVWTSPDMSRYNATSDEVASEEKTKLEERIKELELQKAEVERENFYLKITNCGKDYLVEQLKNERAYFESVRQEMTKQLIERSERVGELQVKLQLEAPRREEPKPTEQKSTVIDVTPVETKHEETEENVDYAL